MKCECIDNTLPTELTSEEKKYIERIRRPQLLADVDEALFGADNSQAKKLTFPLREMD
jgi:hypothetical protein